MLVGITGSLAYKYFLIRVNKKLFGLKTNWGGHFYSNREIDFRTKMRWTKTYDACVKLGI